jgi:hypothetical protein
MPWTCSSRADDLERADLQLVSIRIRRGWRLFALAGVALLGAALLNAPWWTLLAISALYLAMMPFSIASYARVKRRRASAAAGACAGRRTRSPRLEAHADRANRLAGWRSTDCP